VSHGEGGRGSQEGHSAAKLMRMTCRTFQAAAQAAASQAGAAIQGASSQVDLNATSTKLSRSFQTLTQTVRERTGATDDVTELPQGECRVGRSGSCDVGDKVRESAEG
jgi:hypothetical protein